MSLFLSIKFDIIESCYFNYKKNNFLGNCSLAVLKRLGKLAGKNGHHHPLGCATCSMPIRGVGVLPQCPAGCGPLGEVAFRFTAQ